MSIKPGDRVYLAGCGGMLGDAVFAHFSQNYDVRASDIKPRTEWLGQIDIADYDSFYADVSDFEPHLLVNLAAQTDLEWCELNARQAWRDNALGAENAALIANKLDIAHVYISTAGIFGGEKAEFNDFDEPNPLTVYAQSKLWGERFVSRQVEKHFVLRAGWMMGGGPDLDKKFVNKLYQQIKAGADTIYAVTDKLGTPTYTKNFAQGIEKLASTELYGIYNQVCEGQSSRFDVAVAFVEAIGLADRVQVVPVTSDHFAKEFFAERPASEQLVNLKLNERGINVMGQWRDCLQEYAEVFRADLASAEA